MFPYRAQHADLFRTVAEILVRDYIAPSETADTVAEFCYDYSDSSSWRLVLFEPSELAEFIADVERYEKR